MYSFEHSSLGKLRLGLSPCPPDRFPQYCLKFFTTAGLHFEHFAVLILAVIASLIYVRRSLIDFHTEFAAQTIHNYVQMEFAHARNNGLTGLVIALNGKCGVLL